MCNQARTLHLFTTFAPRTASCMISARDHRILCLIGGSNLFSSQALVRLTRLAALVRYPHILRRVSRDSGRYVKITPIFLRLFACTSTFGSCEAHYFLMSSYSPSGGLAFSNSGRASWSSTKHRQQNLSDTMALSSNCPCESGISSVIQISIFFFLQIQLQTRHNQTSSAREGGDWPI